MNSTWPVGLVIAIAAMSAWGGAARAQGWGPADDGPRVFVNGQPYGAPQPQTDDGVRVDITADNPAVRLIRVDGDRETDICAAPCGVVVPRKAEYQLAGEGIVRTSRFTLPDNRPDLHLYVDAGSASRRTAGIVLGVAGYGMFVAADLFLEVEGKGNTQTLSSHTRNVGLALVGSGLVLGTVGLVLILTTRTRVATSSGVTFSHLSRSGRRTAIRLTPAGLEF